MTARQVWKTLGLVVICVPKYRFDEIAINSTEKKKPVEADKDTYIGLEHLDSGCLEVTRWGSDVAPIGDKLVMRKGDVLFGRRRAYQKKVAIAPFDGIFSAHGMVLRPIESVISKEFFPFFISSDYFLDAAIKISVGSLSPTINWRDLAKLEFQIPTLDEQEAISSILWAMNRLKVAYTDLLQQANALVQSQFVEMFGDPVINEKGWKLVPLSELAEIRIGPFGSLLHKEDYVQGGHPLINPSHIIDGVIKPDEELSLSDEKYNELAPYQLRINDVVLGRRGEMGRCAVVHVEGYFCGTGSLIIRPNKAVAPYFLQKIISYPSFRREIEGVAVGVTMQNLNVPIVSNFKIPLLPRNMQERYLQLVESTDKSKYCLQKAQAAHMNYVRR